MSILDFLSAGSSTRPEIIEVRERLLQALLLTFTIFGTLTAVVASYLAFRAGQPYYAAFYLVLFAPLLFGTLLGTRISYNLRGGLLLSVTMAIGVVTLLRLGLSGAGIEIVTTCTVIATVLFGPRLGLLLVGLSLVSIVVAGSGIVIGFLPVEVETLLTSLRGVAWINAAMVFTLFSFVLILSPEILRRRLEVALTDEEQKTRDLTVANQALQEAEVAARKSEQRFRDLAELLPETIFETDLSSQLTYANAAAYRTFGYRPEDLEKGFSALQMLDPSEHERAMARIVASFQGEPMELQEYLACRRDGSTFPVLVRSAPVLVDGVPVGLRGFIIDISEKKEVESHLQQAQKMEAVGTLAGGIAHDFNNLLTGILGRVELIQRRPDDRERLPQHLATLREHIESAAGLTRQLLGLARGGKYDPRPTDLGALVERTLEIFDRTHKELTTHLELEASLWSVEADRNQLEQVILNLLLNARQAMPTGGRISVATHNLDLDESRAAVLGLKPGPHVCLEVGDTGVGMSAAVRERIFEPFFTTQESGRGTGLGLASVYGIVRNHGGGVEVETAPGEGSTFRIFLPAAPEQAPTSEVARESTLPGGEETVLLVDDEVLILNVTAPLLESLGYTVLRAGGGEEALALLQAHPGEIDLVLLDLVMPGLSGAATFERMQALGPTPKVLLSSGYSAESGAAALLEQGCGGFLPKPYDVEQLARKVRSVLDGAP